MSTSYSSSTSKIHICILVEFAGTKIKITPCFLGMKILHIPDWSFNARKNELFPGKFGKTLQLSPLKRNNENLFLIDAELQLTSSLRRFHLV